MGWASGTNVDGREVGYGILATCAQDGCAEEIDRGLYYACGDSARVFDSTAPGCGDHFCAEHLFFAQGTQLCQGCLRPDECGVGAIVPMLSDLAGQGDAFPVLHMSAATAESVRWSTVEADGLPVVVHDHTVPYGRVRLEWPT
jgi:hypothetical protein